MTAYLAEPSRFQQSVMVSMLKTAGFLVTVFDDPEHLVAHVRNADDPVDLVCIALQYRGMTGIDLATQLRTFHRTARVPIVMITGSDNQTVVRSALEHGVTEVFFKSDLSEFNNYLTLLSTHHSDRVAHHGEILYVEDSVTSARQVMALLTGAGYTVSHVLSGEAALEQFLSAARVGGARAPTSRDYAGFDLVITDFLLKGKMSGLGLIRDIRAADPITVPILVLSGFQDSIRKVELFNAGANDYVAKPVVQEELLARVRVLVRNKQLMDEIERQRVALYELATRDNLTGLYNRSSFVERLSAELTDRQSKGTGLAVVDIDRFKLINDTHGHTGGDTVLSAVAHALAQGIADHGIAARIGGEEFALIVRDCEAGALGAICERLRATVERLKPEGIAVTISLGFVHSSAQPVGGERRFESLYQAADAALYAAKSGGRNRVVQANNDA